VNDAYGRFRGLAPAGDSPALTQGSLKKMTPVLARIVPHAIAIRSWRSAAAAGLVLAALVMGIFYAPARRAFADFLSIFRVRQFTAVSVDHARFEKLQELQEALRSTGIVNPIIERQPGEPRPVADAAEASSVAGFAVRVPAELPDGAVRTDFSVAAGPAIRVDVDRDQIQAQLESVGLPGIALPNIKSGTFRADISSIVRQSYRVGDQPTDRGACLLEVVQVLSPAVSLPSGVDPRSLGETLLQLLGVPAADAGRLAATIDWTSTMVVPLPTDLATFREIVVGGTPGLYVEQKAPSEGSHRPGSALLWQQDGIVYSVHGENIAASELLRVAESLR